MAQLAVKHENQTVVEYRDFSGGLNTSNADEMIAMNELSKAINVEIDKSTGLLRTVAGTETLVERENANFTAFAYDDRSETFLLIGGTDATAYAWTEGSTSMEDIGTLTGSVYPAFAPWEDGILIASGGKMQYFHGGTMATLADSPDECDGVFVKDGRVWTYYGDVLHASAVGDEESWTQDSAQQESAQWLEIGYKDGGKIVGVTNLSSDILIIKSNGHVFHLAGQYPDLTLREVSREVSCKGFRSCVSLVNEAVILGYAAVQTVSTTDTYGDMQAREVSTKIPSNIRNLPAHTRLKYLAPLNQIWFLDDTSRILFLDVSTGGYFEREYQSSLRDVVSVRDTVYLLKRDRVQKLNKDSVMDEGLQQRFRWRSKTLVSHDEYLVKRVQVDITPFTDNYFDCWFTVGKFTVQGTLPKSAMSLYHDYTDLYLSPRDLYGIPNYPLYQNSDELYANDEYLYENETELFSLNSFRTDMRCVERMKAVKLECKGKGGQVLFNGLMYDVAEV